MQTLLLWQAVLVGALSVGLGIWLQTVVHRALVRKYGPFCVLRRDLRRDAFTLGLFTAGSLALSFALGQSTVAFVALSVLLPLIGFMALFDLEFQLIPDRFQIGVFVIALVTAMLMRPASDVAMGLASGALLGAVLWVASAAYEKWRERPALGRGDIKFLVALSPLCGRDTLMILTLSCLLCLVVLTGLKLRKKAQMPETFAFGPYLVASVTAWLLYSF